MRTELGNGSFKLHLNYKVTASFKGVQSEDTSGPFGGTLVVVFTFNTCLNVRVTRYTISLNCVLRVEVRSQ
jgi:hypothetical protein